MPFTKQPQAAPFKPFIDYKSGRQLQGEEYWQTLDVAFFNYINHPEHKFENGSMEGVLDRRKLTETQKRYIGKEIKSIELIKAEQGKQSIKDILNMSIAERKRAGISRQKRYYWKRRYLRDI